MMPLAFSNVSLSKSIREQKKKRANKEPELVDTSPGPDLNAQDIYDIDQDARIESTLNSPEKSNADETMMNETYHGVGLSPAEKKRMGRLRSYMETMELSGK